MLVCASALIAFAVDAALPIAGGGFLPSADISTSAVSSPEPRSIFGLGVQRHDVEVIAGEHHALQYPQHRRGLARAGGVLGQLGHVGGLGGELGLGDDRLGDVRFGCRRLECRRLEGWRLEAGLVGHGDLRWGPAVGAGISHCRRPCRAAARPRRGAGAAGCRTCSAPSRSPCACPGTDRCPAGRRTGTPGSRPAISR